MLLVTLEIASIVSNVNVEVVYSEVLHFNQSMNAADQFTTYLSVTCHFCLVASSVVRCLMLERVGDSFEYRHDYRLFFTYAAVLGSADV
jgi:hypothetical protein